MSVREADDPELFARVQEQNLLRQYDLLTNCIEIGLSKGIEAFDKYSLWSLNAVAVANVAQFGGVTAGSCPAARSSPNAFAITARGTTLRFNLQIVTGQRGSSTSMSWPSTWLICFKNS